MKAKDERYFTTKEGFEAEGRVFYAGEVYTARYEQWDKDTLSVNFFAENGYFNFTSELFERVIVGWELVEVDKPKASDKEDEDSELFDKEL